MMICFWISPRPRLQKKIETVHLTGFAKTWLQKSLYGIYWQILVVEHVFFFMVTFIYLISTEYLLNRLQYIDFDEFLTGHQSTPAPQKVFHSFP